MGELGTWLRETRESLALSLEDIEAKTRIRRSFLEALEEGVYEALPGEAHAAGFLRNYALCLGLDTEEVRRRYRAEVPSQEAHQPHARQRDFEPTYAALEAPSRTVLSLLVRVSVTIVFVAAVAGLGVWYWHGSPLPPAPNWWPPRVYLPRLQPTIPGWWPPRIQLPQLQPARTADYPLVTAHAITSIATAEPPPAAKTALPPTVSPTHSSTRLTRTARTLLASAVLPSPTATLLSTATATPTATAVIISPSAEGVHLRVDPIERAWLQVTVDGAIDFEGILEVGQERVWQAQRSIALRCGNAGGVLIAVNGEELGTLGERGQVVERTWTLDETTPTPQAAD